MTALNSGTYPPELRSTVVDGILRAGNSTPSSVVFAIDVSGMAFQIGAVQAAADAIGAAVSVLPPDTRVGLIAFANDVHFIVPRRNRPCIVTISPSKSLFVPRERSFLRRIDQWQPAFHTVLEMLPRCFSRDGLTASGCDFYQLPQLSSVGYAIRVALELFTDPGQLIVFASTNPTMGVSKLSPTRRAGAQSQISTPTAEDDIDPQSQASVSFLGCTSAFYAGLAREALHSSVGVHEILLLDPTAPVDAPTLATVARTTGGSLRVYPCFLAARDSPRLQAELCAILAQPPLFCCSCRAIASQGITVRPEISLGSTGDGELHVSILPQDAQLGFRINHSPACTGYVQFVLRYRTVSGVERVRVMTTELPDREQIDVDATLGCLARAVSGRLMGGGWSLSRARSYLLRSLALLWSLYPTHERERELLLLYVHGLLNSPILTRQREVSDAERVACAYRCLVGSLRAARTVAYPRLLALDAWLLGETERPEVCRLTIAALTGTLYLAALPGTSLLFVAQATAGRDAVSARLLHSVLALPNGVALADLSAETVEQLAIRSDTPESRQLEELIRSLEPECGPAPTLYVVLQGSFLYPAFAGVLVEDYGAPDLESLRTLLGQSEWRAKTL